MARITDVAAYLCENYPHKSELSKTRLTKLVYLSDWKAAQKVRQQMTGIKWYFHNFGPYVPDVVEAVESDPRFAITSSINHYGDPKMEISVREGVNTSVGLSKEEKSLLDEVIAETSPLYWNAFIEHVYATPPIEKSNRYRLLNLLEFAQAPSVVETSP